MTCSVDQYKLTYSGWHLPTYLRCKNGNNNFYLYQLVPDHQTSLKIGKEQLGDVGNSSQDLTVIPQVEQKESGQSVDDDTDDGPDLSTSSATKPK